MNSNRMYRICMEVWEEEGEACPCYGLVCGERVIRFISPDRRLVERMAEVLNAQQPHESRVLDIVEQMLP